MKKLTLEDIDREVHRRNLPIKILSKTYEGCRSKLVIECLDCGNIFEKPWMSIKSGQLCQKCALKRRSDSHRLTLEEVEGKLKTLNPNILILSNSYVDSTTKLECKCDICDHEFSKSWRDLSQKANCPNCTKLKDRKKLTIHDIKSRIKKISPNIIILSDEYLEYKQKLKCKCSICGKEWGAVLSNLSKGSNCPNCANKHQNDSRKVTLKEAVARLKIINPNILILSNSYNGSPQKLKCKCLVCDNEWEASFTHLQNNHGCKPCAIKNSKGKGNGNWKGGITPISIYLREAITQWRTDSMKHCNYKCQITGDEFDDVHHLYGFDLIVKESLTGEGLPIHKDLTNYTEKELERIVNRCLLLHSIYGLGICLTREIHQEFHNIYGRGKNTPEQWQEFLELKQQEKTS